MQLTIASRGDPPLTLDVESSATVRSVKAQVAEALGYVAAHQQLYAADRPRRPLRNSETLTGAGVNDGATPN